MRKYRFLAAQKKRSKKPNQPGMSKEVGSTSMTVIGWLGALLLWFINKMRIFGVVNIVRIQWSNFFSSLNGFAESLLIHAYVYGIYTYIHAYIHKYINIYIYTYMIYLFTYL